MKRLVLVLFVGIVFFGCGDKQKTKTKPKPKLSNIELGKRLYKTCISCHGVRGEEDNIGIGSTIEKWNKKQIVDALNGYKKRTYGRKMKTIMYNHVRSLNKKKMEQIADYLVDANKNLKK